LRRPSSTKANGPPRSNISPPPPLEQPPLDICISPLASAPVDELLRRIAPVELPPVLEPVLVPCPVVPPVLEPPLLEPPELEPPELVPELLVIAPVDVPLVVAAGQLGQFETKAARSIEPHPLARS